MEFEEHDGKQNGRLGPRSLSMNRLRRSMRNLLRGGKKKGANKKHEEKQTTDSREFALQSHRDSIDLSTSPSEGQNLSRSLELLDRQSSLQIRQSRQSNERLIQEYRHNNDNVAQKQLVQGQSVQGQLIKGHPVQGQLVQGKLIQGHLVRGQSVQRQLIQGHPVQGQLIQGHPVQGQLVQGHPVQGQLVQGHPVQGQLVPGQSVHGQLVQGHPVQGQSVHGQFVRGQSVQGQSVLGQSVQGQPVHGQLVQGQLAQRQLVHGQLVQGHPVQGQSVQGPLVLAQSVQGQSVQGQPVHGQLVLGQSIQGPQAVQVNNEVLDLRNGTELKHVAQGGGRLIAERPHGTEVSGISTFEMHAGEGSQTRSPGSSHFRHDRLDSGVEILSPDTERTHSFYVSDDTAGRSLRSQWTNAWVVQTQQQPASHIVLQPIRIELQSRPSNEEQVNRTTDPGGGLRSESADPLLSRAARLRETRSDDEGVRGRSLSVGTHLERSLRSQRTNDWVGQLAPVRIQGELQPREPVSYRSAPDAARKIIPLGTKPRLDPDDTYDRFETFVQSLDKIRTDSDPDDAPMTMAYWLQNCAWSRYSHVEGFWRYPRYARDYPLDGTKNRRSRGRRSKSLGPVTSGGAHSASEDERGRGYRQVLVPSRSRQESSDVDGDREHRHESRDHVSSRSGRRRDRSSDHNRHRGKENGHLGSRNSRERSSGRRDNINDRPERSNQEGRTRSRRHNNRKSHGRNQRRGNTKISASSDGRSRSQDRSRPTAGVHVETKVEGDVSKDSAGTQLKQRASSTASTGKASEGNVSKNNPVTTGNQKTTEGTEDGIKRSLSVAMSVGLLAGKQKDDTKTEGKSEASQPGGKGSAQETTSRSPGVTSVFKRSFFGSKSDDKDQAGSPTDTQGTQATVHQTGTDDTKARGDAGSRKGLLSASLFGALKSEKQNDDIKTRGNSDSHPVGKDGVQEQTTRSPGVTSVFKRSFFGSKSDDKDQAGSPTDTQGTQAAVQQAGTDDTKARGDSGFGSVFKRSFFTSKAADNDSDALSMHSIKGSVVKNDEKPKEESGSFSFMSMIRRRSSSASSLSSSEDDDRKKGHRRPVVTGGRKNADKDPESAGMFGNAMQSFKGLFGDDGKSLAEKESEHTIMSTGRGRLSKKEAEHSIMATQGSKLSRKEAEHSIMATQGSSLEKKEAEFGLMASQRKTLAEKEAEHSMMASMGKGQNQSESSGIFGGLFGMFSGGDGKSQAEREAEHSIMASRGDDSDGSSSQGRRESILGALGLHDSSSSSSSSSDDEDGAISSLFSAIGLGSADATGPRKHGGGHKKQDAMKSAWAKRDRGGGAKKGGDSSIFGFLGFGGDSDAHRHSHGHRHRHRERAPSTPTTPQLPSIFSSFQPN
ncbi:PREDICTED: uncharacterized protein LOC109469180 [Branchiostoma belcheri]|uniref:Uncharacterized protein LOC109469180 n=1 Tax=Branchiostoma belcheri TaxID=7741 RepID=A0A6P4YWQ0_BRABE|nr:PREDICTED: uncharacterized protein LOC109469180 [Branchiostoma belcheri]